MYIERQLALVENSEFHIYIYIYIAEISAINALYFVHRAPYGGEDSTLYVIYIYIYLYIYIYIYIYRSIFNFSVKFMLNNHLLNTHKFSHFYYILYIHIYMSPKDSFF